MDVHKKEIGHLAEQMACDFLRKKGLKLLERNFNCRVGEIDLIMQDGNEIVFVEVRSRSRNDFGSALESITLPKRKRVAKTAAYFLQKKKWLGNVDYRFDIIGIDGDINKPSIEWVDNAFSLEVL